MNRHLQIRLAFLKRANIWLRANKSAPWLIDLLDDKRVFKAWAPTGAAGFIGGDLPVGRLVDGAVESFFRIFRKIFVAT